MKMVKSSYNDFLQKMLNLSRYIRSINKYILINIRYSSVNKSDLILSSRNIQFLLKSNPEQSSILKWLYISLNDIHEQYPAIKLATSRKDLYQINSSKLNSIYLQLENDRKKQTGDFEKDNNEELIILLRYIRYLQVAFIYRLITFDINCTLKDIFHSILTLTKTRDDLNKKCGFNSLSLICELIFFVNFLSAHHSLSDVKGILSRTYISNYLCNYLYEQLNEDNSILLINELCSTLHSIMEIPSLSTIDFWPCALLKYLHKKKCNSLSIIKYLILIQHGCIHQSSSEMLSILNKYLIETGICQENFDIICQLLILISSCHYSHQLFHQRILQKLENTLKDSSAQNPLLNVKLCCRLIYYLCLNDPTNRFQSRTIIIQLSEEIYQNLDQEKVFPQWIVQSQHGMMLLNIYHYPLLFSTLQQTFFPLLFRDLGIYSLTIHRQLFDIHYALTIDRPTIKSPLLNCQMLSFATKISKEYRSSIRSNQKSYNRFLNQLKEFFHQIYGEETCQIIDTNETIPYLLFDFLELNLSDKDELKAIGINTKQRVAILPILNSMLIRQQRSDGCLVRVLSAHTTMRYRLIEKMNYQVLPIFHNEYLRAIRDKTMKTIFETNLALKSLPQQSDNNQAIQC